MFHTDSNKGIVDGYDNEFVLDLSINFISILRSKLPLIISGKKSQVDREFIEFLLIESFRSLLWNMPPQAFYLLYRSDMRIKEALPLKYLNSYGVYNRFRQKRKNYRRYFDRFIKRNLLGKIDEMYALDTFILEVDLRKLKNATKIKSGKFDVEFLYKPGEGTVAGVICAVLVNLSNFSLVEVNFYSKHAKKVDIWEDMVLNTIGTKTGQIKTVIADSGFFCYDIFKVSREYRIIPVIKIRKNTNLDKFYKIAGTMQMKLEFFENKSIKLAQVLIEDIRMIVAKTVENSLNYDKGFAKIRSGIEMLFKVAKRVFKQNNVHVYYTDKMHYKLYFTLYISSILIQFCKEQNVSINRLIERVENDISIY